MNLIRKYITNVSRAIKASRALIAILSAVTFSSCINEDAKVPEDNNTHDTDFYITLQVSTPSEGNTRSVTNPDGSSSSSTLLGETNENIINSAHLYFYDQTQGDTKGSKLCEFTATLSDNYPKIEENGQSSYKITAKVELDDLRKIMGKTVKLYVLANQDKAEDAASGSAEDKLRNGSFSIDDLSFGASKFGTEQNEQYCPMSNQSEFIIDLEDIENDGLTNNEFMTALLELFNKDYNKGLADEGRLWDISNVSTQDKEAPGVLKLERSIARVDYGDTRTESDPDGLSKHVYKLEWAAEGDIYLKLVSMELFNLEKKAYTFRHTAAGTRSAAGETVLPFGIENNDVTGDTYKWVAHVNWNSGSHDFFNAMSSILDENGKTIWNYTADNSVARITSSALDSWITTHSKTDTDYVPWFYVMENTVSSTDDMTLENCTGVNFHMLVCKNKQGNGKEKSGNDPLRITLGDVAGELAGYYQEIDWREAVKDGETEVEPAGYYLDYRYLIEHNNDNSETVNSETGNKGISNLAPMQIGIVRNNVYQLSLKSIRNLPQPDEPDNVYISVSVNVLDWVRKHQYYDF